MKFYIGKTILKDFNFKSFMYFLFGLGEEFIFLFLKLNEQSLNCKIKGQVYFNF